MEWTPELWRRYLTASLDRWIRGLGPPPPEQFVRDTPINVPDTPAELFTD